YSIVTTFHTICSFFFLMILPPPRSTLFSLHDALPIWNSLSTPGKGSKTSVTAMSRSVSATVTTDGASTRLSTRSWSRPRSCRKRSEEHTSELQSLAYLVCRLLLEKKKTHHKQLKHLEL